MLVKGRSKGATAEVVDVSSDLEVGLQDPLLVIVILEMGEHDVGRFDITVAVGSARPGLRGIQAVRD